jgi:hypothetical protein
MSGTQPKAKVEAKAKGKRGIPKGQIAEIKRRHSQPYQPIRVKPHELKKFLGL